MADRDQAFDLTVAEESILRAVSEDCAQLCELLAPRLSVLAIDLELGLAGDAEQVAPTPRLLRALND